MYIEREREREREYGENDSPDKYMREECSLSVRQLQVCPRRCALPSRNAKHSQHF